jgi:hypothetical protein
MVITTLKNLIPSSYMSFNKLTSGRPYRFKAWKKDQKKRECLYYRFKGSTGIWHQKRIPTAEIKTAARHVRRNGVFNRGNFKTLCPVASSGGPCSFAVLGRCLEYLGLVTYKGYGKGFERTI